MAHYYGAGVEKGSRRRVNWLLCDFHHRCLYAGIFLRLLIVDIVSLRNRVSFCSASVLLPAPEKERR
jgi:hypothetical protein